MEQRVRDARARPSSTCVVVDTPPAQHALDFLEAPERLLDLLDSRVVQLLIHPAMSAGRLGLRLFQRGAHQAFAPDRARSPASASSRTSPSSCSPSRRCPRASAGAPSACGSCCSDPTPRFVLAAAASGESVAHASDFLARLEGFGAHVRRRRRESRAQLARRRAAPSRKRPRRVPRARCSARSRASTAPRSRRTRAAEAALAVLDGYAAAVARDAQATAPLLDEASLRGRFVRRIPELPARRARSRRAGGRRATILRRRRRRRRDGARPSQHAAEALREARRHAQRQRPKPRRCARWSTRLRSPPAARRRAGRARDAAQGLDGIAAGSTGRRAERRRVLTRARRRARRRDRALGSARGAGPGRALGAARVPRRARAAVGDERPFAAPRRRPSPASDAADTDERPQRPASARARRRVERVPVQG